MLLDFFSRASHGKNQFKKTEVARCQILSKCGTTFVKLLLSVPQSLTRLKEFVSFHRTAPARADAEALQQSWIEKAETPVLCAAFGDIISTFAEGKNFRRGPLFFRGIDLS